MRNSVFLLFEGSGKYSCLKLNFGISTNRGRSMFGNNIIGDAQFGNIGLLVLIEDDGQPIVASIPKL